MPPKVYLIVYRSRLFPAHWSLWIPSDRISPNQVAIGKIIHVTGDSRQGFVHEFKRNYELDGTGRAYDMLPFGSVSDSTEVVDVVGNGEFSTDNVASDIIEEYALAVPAPGKSLRSTSTEPTKAKVSIQNCQTWMRQFVGKLVEEKVLLETALQVVEEAPVN